MKRSIGAKTPFYPAPTWIVGSFDTQDKARTNASAGGSMQEAVLKAKDLSARRPTQ